MTYRPLVAFLLLCIITASYASSFPRGCEVSGFSYNGSYLVLNEQGKQSFFLLQNQSDHAIDLQRVENQNAFMSPSLSITLEPGNWAAFASDVQYLGFRCSTGQENGIVLDCREVLDVCQYPRVKFALSNMGNYWVSFNKPQRQIINDAASKGILLRW